MNLALLGIGPLEWIVLLGGAVLLFGGDLPAVLRKLARMLGRLRAMAAELSREIDIADTRGEQRPPPGRSAPPELPYDAPEESPQEPTVAPGVPHDAPADDEHVAAPEHTLPREPAGESGPSAEGVEPPDHSDWEPESGADRPARLDGEPPDEDPPPRAAS